MEYKQTAIFHKKTCTMKIWWNKETPKEVKKDIADEERKKQVLQTNLRGQEKNVLMKAKEIIMLTTEKSAPWREVLSLGGTLVQYIMDGIKVYLIFARYSKGSGHRWKKLFHIWQVLSPLIKPAALGKDSLNLQNRPSRERKLQAKLGIKPSNGIQLKENWGQLEESKIPF